MNIRQKRVNEIMSISTSMCFQAIFGAFKDDRTKAFPGLR